MSAVGTAYTFARITYFDRLYHWVIYISGWESHSTGSMYDFDATDIFTEFCHQVACLLLFMMQKAHTFQRCVVRITMYCKLSI